MDKELADAVIGLLIGAFQAGHAPRRKWIVLNIQRDYPHLDHPRLDLQVGLALNHLVDSKILKRIDAKYYAPGKKYTS